MRKRLPSLIATALITLFTYTAWGDTPSTDPMLIEAAKSFVCQNLGVDCTDVPTPHVDYVIELAFWGWYGAYDPQTDVEGLWLHPDYYGLLADREAFDLQAFSTLVHEMTHYVEWHTTYLMDIERWNAADCYIEATAFSLERHWLETAEWQEYADSLSNWYTYYDGCESLAGA